MYSYTNNNKKYTAVMYFLLCVPRLVYASTRTHRTLSVYDIYEYEYWSTVYHEL